MLETDIQELERVTGVRRPEARPPVQVIECYAIELNQEIADLQTRINDYLADEEDLPIHETLDSMRLKLRQARLARDRLPPFPNLPPPVPSSRGRLQLHQIFRPPHADPAAEPVRRPRVLPGVGIIVENPDARADTVANDDDNSMPEHRNGQNSRDVPTGYTTAWSLGTNSISNPYAGHPILPRQTRGETNLASNTNPIPAPVSEAGANRIIAEGTGRDRFSNPDPTEEDAGPSSSSAASGSNPRSTAPTRTAQDVLDDDEALYSDAY